MTACSEHLRWPPERFYWALVEAAGFARCGELPIGLRSLLEEEVPLPGDQLHAVCAPASGGVVLVCAASIPELASLPSGTLSLTPQVLPSFAPPGTGPEALNLLVGAFEPCPLRRARDRRHALAAFSLLLCAVAIGLGLIRREQRWRFVAEQADNAIAALLPPTSSSIDALALEVARLRRVGVTTADDAPPSDAALALASLLAAWPAEAAAAPHSISVGPAGISLAVTVEGEPSAFLGAFSSPPGWHLDEPRLNAVGALTRLNLHLRRKVTP